MKDNYGVNPIPNSLSTRTIISKENNNNRYWPVDPSNRYNIRNHQQRKRNTYRYKTHYHQRQFYCRQCARRSYITTSGNFILYFKILAINIVSIHLDTL